MSELIPDPKSVRIVVVVNAALFYLFALRADKRIMRLHEVYDDTFVRVFVVNIKCTFNDRLGTDSFQFVIPFVTPELYVVMEIVSDSLADDLWIC
ncbi:hypothetical protein BRD03_02225 [Halobacteriales archaeon QS_9_68_17]|nr:MAG: hypothetical protein BRD03_02225 [Halobacteriales archaeon QS_9_68_17]